MAEAEKEKVDPLLNFKYIGYCVSCLPPGEIQFSDFVKYAKFHLCAKNHILMKSPVWNNYTDEDVLVEYFATLYYNDSEARGEFEATIGCVDDDLYDWFEEMEAKNKEELNKKLNDLGDNIKFSPSDVEQDNV